MEDEKQIYGAAAVVVALVAAYSLFGHAPAAKRSAGPGWFSRLSPFGSPPSQEPAPASNVPAPELAPPERMMQNAMTRQFSNPSGGNSGGLAAEAAGSASAPESAASMNAPRLGGGDVNLPGGGRAPTSGSASVGARGPGAVGGASSAGGSQTAAAGGGGGGSGSGAGGSKGGAGGGGSAGAGSSVGGTASAGGPRGAGAAGGGAGGPGFKGGSAGQLSGSSSGGGGGPPGGDSGGGKGAGLEAKTPEAKGKELAQNAAKDHAGATAAGASPVGGAGGMDGVGGGGQQAPPAAVIGAPQLGTSTVRGGDFSSYPNGPADVPTTVYTTATGAHLVSFTAKMAIDADGKGPAAATDPLGKPHTSLKYSDGSSLNSEVVPFIVVPTDFYKTHPDVKLGDYVAVTYGAKTVFAIIGDMGPPGVLGEGSMALASGLGIDPDPVKGGIQRRDIRYTIIPGTADKEPPRSAAEIATRGQAWFATAGAPVR